MSETPRITRRLTIQEAAQAARVTTRTVYRWIASGQLRTVQTVSGHQRIEEAWLFRPTYDDEARA